MAQGAFVPRADRVTTNQEFAAVEQHLSEYVTDLSRTGAFIRSKDPLRWAPGSTSSFPSCSTRSR